MLKSFKKNIRKFGETYEKVSERMLRSLNRYMERNIIEEEKCSWMTRRQSPEWHLWEVK
jgi:pyruvate-formate lyase